MKTVFKELSEQLFALDEMPQFGASLHFPWEQIEGRLKELFETDQVQLSHNEKGWVAKENLFQGMPGAPLPVAISLVPLSCPFYFVTGEEDLNALLEALVGEKGDAPFFEADERQGFYDYLLLQLMAVISSTQFTDDLVPHLREDASELGSEDCFVIDVALRIKEVNVWGCLLIPATFRRQWKGHFEAKPLPPITPESAKKVMVDLCFEAGSVELSVQEWKEARRGDFIVLDQLHVDLRGQGRLLVKAGGKPLFRGKIKGDSVKLFEYPFYDEGQSVMSEENREDQEEDLGALEELQHEEEVEEGVVEEKVESNFREMDPGQIPLQMSVEVARVRLSLDDLMNLAPGNVLDLHVSLERGVDLVINGKKMGRGELIKAGDTVGVRILSL